MATLLGVHVCISSSKCHKQHGVNFPSRVRLFSSYGVLICVFQHAQIHLQSYTLAHLFLGWQEQYLLQMKNWIIYKTKSAGLPPKLEVRVIRFLGAQQMGRDLHSLTTCHHFAFLLLYECIPSVVLKRPPGHVLFARQIHRLSV